MYSNIGNGSAHGKIILIGEHSVVYGYPAIAIPFTTLEINVKISKNNTACILLQDKFHNGEINFDLAAQSPIICAIKETLTYLKQPSDVGLTISTNSSIPSQGGLGSSAAISVATIRALFDFFKIPLEDKILMQLAHKAEKIAHENPSGLDVFLCTHSTSVIFNKNKSIKPISINLDAFLVIVDTGTAGKTKEAVTKIKNNYHRQITKDLLAKLNQWTQKSILAIKHKDLYALGTYMTNAHICLQQLGVSSDKLDSLIEICLNTHAYGAKLTGGGLGGNFIALVKTQSDAERLIKRLEQEKIGQIWMQEI